MSARPATLFRVVSAELRSPAAATFSTRESVGGAADLELTGNRGFAGPSRKGWRTRLAFSAALGGRPRRFHFSRA